MLLHDWRKLALVALLALPLAAVGCEAAEEVGDAGATTDQMASDAPSGEVVEFVSTDYSFDGPDTLPAGWNTIRLRNDGQELHHVLMWRLEDGKTLADLEAHLASGDPADPTWAVNYGGPNASIGPFQAESTIWLDPGEYAAVCVIPSPDGQTHLAKGMMKTITVSGGSDAPEPVADMSVDLGDFVFVRDTAYTAGQHTVAVTNSGAQPHEIVLVKLDEGATAADFTAAFAPDAPPGPPPGMPVGGLAPMAPGQKAYFQTELTPGNYAALCFLMDPESGAPHFALGMSEEFTVE